MFFQPPDEENNSVKPLQSNAKSRRQKKLRRKNKLKAIKKELARNKSRNNCPVSRKHPRITQSHSHSAVSGVGVPITMSSWAENFTKAATWQLKHQVAYWKSKAIALEYENKLLHEVIRKNYINGGGKSHSENSEMPMKHEDDLEDVDSENNEEYVEEDPDGGFEVSEEYIQFLMENKKYRDDAKRERERLRAQNDTERKVIEEMEAGPPENQEDPQEVLKNLYGDNWEKISALEMSLRSQFISDCDRDKPMHWPNIPFNFNYS